MSDKHTPTPWHLDVSTRYAINSDGRHIAMVSSMERRIGDGEENEANARYIVKAVNNHERLVEALLSVDWDKAADWGIVDPSDRDKAISLLDELDNLEPKP